VKFKKNHINESRIVIQLYNSTEDSPAAAPYICILDLNPGKKNAFYYSALKKHGIFTSFLTTKM